MVIVILKILKKNLNLKDLIWIIFFVNNKVVTITHGHYYNYYELLANCGEIFIQGHTHIPILQKQNNRIMANLVL